MWFVIQSLSKKGAKVALAGQRLVQTLFASKASRKLEAQTMKYFFSWLSMSNEHNLVLKVFLFSTGSLITF